MAYEIKCYECNAVIAHSNTHQAKIYSQGFVLFFCKPCASKLKLKRQLGEF